MRRRDQRPTVDVGKVLPSSWTADERERAADEREQAADEREQAADDRERIANVRDRIADQREDAADQREQLANGREASSGGSERERERQKRADHRVQREQAGFDRQKATIQREIAASDRRARSAERPQPKPAAALTAQPPLIAAKQTPNQMQQTTRRLASSLSQTSGPHESMTRPGNIEPLNAPAKLHIELDARPRAGSNALHTRAQ